jgi:hypothetical protein
MPRPLMVETTRRLSETRRNLVDTQRLLESNHRLLTVTRAQIADGRRLLNPWWTLSGGSDSSGDDGEAKLYRKVRARLERHTLPPAPTYVEAARAMVPVLCAVCGRGIRPGEIQNESLTSDGTKEWSHTVCLRIWIDVTVESRRRVPSSAAPPGLPRAG